MNREPSKRNWTISKKLCASAQSSLSWSLRLLLGCLLAIHVLLVLQMNWANGLGRTEVGHLGSAIYFSETNRLDVFHVNPPLTRMIISFPISLCDPLVVLHSYSPVPIERCEWSLGSDFVSNNSEATIRWCTFVARSSLLPFTLVGGFFGYLLAREMFGQASGYVFMILYCFSPFVLAWNATICPDATATSLGVLAIYQFRRWLLAPTITRMIVAGITLGLLPLAKLTWIIAFPLWLSLWLLWKSCCSGDAQPIERTAPSWKAMVVVWLIALFVIHLGYGFDRSFQSLGSFSFNSQALGGSSVHYQTRDKEIESPRIFRNRFRDSWLGSLPVPLPAELVQGIDTQKYDFDRGLSSYLRGQWSNRGWWYYYLYALGVKEPLGTQCLAILAMAICFSKRMRRFSCRDQLFVLLPGMSILTFVSSQSGFSINARYVLPALPFFYVWISQVASILVIQTKRQSQIVLGCLIVGSIIWTVTSSLSVYPHSLSYFNEMAGGPANGGKHLLGSNLDWGQDVWYLKSWIEKHPEVSISGKLYESAYPDSMIGMKGVSIPPSGPTEDGYTSKRDIERGVIGPLPGWYVVSVNYLYERNTRYRYFLDHFEPAVQIGFSIRIYNISHSEANRVRVRLGLSSDESRN